jgi:hypothetical protein
MHLQTKGSPGHPPKAAKDITMDEFNVIFQALVDELKDREVEAGLSRNERFIICYDNATVHKTAHHILPTGWERLPQPAHSPECNKPIEHVHGQMDQKMHKWLAQWRCSHGDAQPTPTMCMQQCEQFFLGLSAQKISDDVDTLPRTWQAVVAAGGGHIPPAVS